MEQILGSECYKITKIIALPVIVCMCTVGQYNQSSLYVSAHSQ